MKKIALFAYSILFFCSTTYACDASPAILKFIGMKDVASVICAVKGAVYYENGAYAGTPGGSWFHEDGSYAGYKGSAWYHASGWYAGSDQQSGWYHDEGHYAGYVGKAWYYSNGSYAGNLF